MALLSLSLAQARQLVLHSQQLPAGETAAPALDATLQAIGNLGYVQIDTISVVERAHHHTLWSRNPAYRPLHLEQLLVEGKVFEYWSHAAAYLPMRDYRFSLPRKQAFACGEQDHWYQRNPKLISEVLGRIREEGPLMAKDFAHHGKPTGEWHHKPAKQALEYLFMQGDLMVPYRRNFHKVYDLTERALPAWVGTSLPSPAEHADFLIRSFLRAHGLAQEADFSYLLKGVKPQVGQMLRSMLQQGELLEADVEGSRWYLLPESLALLDRPLGNGLAILSPFDNLLIQRGRMRRLFGFDYQIECYVPAPKRKYGYFCLPILWEGALVARMDCKADRKRKVLEVLGLHLEPGLKRPGLFREALGQGMQAFLLFNGCAEIRGLD